MYAHYETVFTVGWVASQDGLIPESAEPTTEILPAGSNVSVVMTLVYPPARSVYDVARGGIFAAVDMLVAAKTTNADRATVRFWNILRGNNASESESESEWVKSEARSRSWSWFPRLLGTLIVLYAATPPERPSTGLLARERLFFRPGLSEICDSVVRGWPTPARRAVVGRSRSTCRPARAHSAGETINSTGDPRLEVEGS